MVILTLIITGFFEILWASVRMPWTIYAAHVTAMVMLACYWATQMIPVQTVKITPPTSANIRLQRYIRATPEASWGLRFLFLVLSSIAVQSEEGKPS